MVEDGFSTVKIRRYLYQWAMWWARTSEVWELKELIEWFIESCWDIVPAAYAAGTMKHHVIESRMVSRGLSSAA